MFVLLKQDVCSVQYKEEFMKLNPEYRWYNPEKHTAARSAKPATRPSNAFIVYHGEKPHSLQTGITPGKLAGQCHCMSISLPSPSPIGVNIRERKSGTKRTKKREKRESTPPCDEMHAKPHLVFFSPPECASGTALHRVDTTWIQPELRLPGKSLIRANSALV